jgi:hypothetical protein
VSCPHDYENADYCPQCQDEAAGAWARSQEGRDSLRAAYERGAADMRQRCAALVDEHPDTLFGHDVSKGQLRASLAAAIRNLEVP